MGDAEDVGGIAAAEAHPLELLRSLRGGRSRLLGRRGRNLTGPRDLRRSSDELRRPLGGDREVVGITIEPDGERLS